MTPLDGVRIAVTRPAAQSRELADALRAAGADVAICPLIQLEPAVDHATARRVLRDIDEFAWIIFTSANGVDHFIRLVAEADAPAGVLNGKRIACVGPATAAAAARHGLATAVIPERFTGEALADALGREPLAGRAVLIPRAAGGGAALPEKLAQAGAVVEELVLYRAVGDPAGAQELKQRIAAGALDVLTFTSGSAVRYFVSTIETPGKMVVAVIGPSTAEAAHGLGVPVDIVADPHTVAGLVAAITDYYAAERGARRTDGE